MRREALLKSTKPPRATKGHGEDGPHRGQKAIGAQLAAARIPGSEFRVPGFVWRLFLFFLLAVAFSGCQSKEKRKLDDLQKLYDKAVTDLQAATDENRVLRAKLDEAGADAEPEPAADGYPVTGVLLDFPEADDGDLPDLVESARRLGGKVTDVKSGPNGVVLRISGQILLTRRRLANAFTQSGWAPLDEILIPFRVAGDPGSGIGMTITVRGYDPGTRIELGGVGFPVGENGTVTITCRVSQSDGGLYYRRNPGDALQQLKTHTDGGRRYLVVSGPRNGKTVEQRYMLP